MLYLTWIMNDVESMSKNIDAYFENLQSIQHNFKELEDIEQDHVKKIFIT